MKTLLLFALTISLSSCLIEKKIEYRTIAYFPEKSKDNEIQINKVPFPFNLNDYTPYIVFVNGERANLSAQQSQHLAKILNLETNGSKTAAFRLSTDGWIRPYSNLK